MNGGGETSDPRTGLSADAVARTLLDLGGTRDFTVTVSPEDVDERLLVAVDGSHAFLGLERPDGLLQFVVNGHDVESATHPFTIGGQQSDIESRYLPELPTAAAVVKEWLDGGEPSAHGHWERQ